MGGEFMAMENARLMGATADEKFSAPNRLDPAVVDGREQAVGKFAVNNGVVAAVDGRGIQYEAPATDSRVKSLRDAGFTEGPVPVYMGTHLPEARTVTEQRWNDIKRADAMKRAA